ncbi:DUF4437 domain-containing protein [Flammeovirga sp. SubArs3]|uniref:DUF4437 domain-containing protein n=1 Tax=Flammeovirga sp. SubArs3 TaxID=2995316 RepID=UPI00248D02B7|nr:DUF4437 domain-containing protein [Flammeovirga sp. SubArs3]
MKKTLSVAILPILFFFACQQTTDKAIDDWDIKNPTNKVMLTKDVQWEQLNPARGDKSPLAGTLWGDRKADVATGYLGKFVDGFSSPPHIHNVTYRAIVIKGSIHNDDPNAEKMWMKPGSFWTQPKGEAHITAAKGEENIAYIEIDQGPYLVKPTDQAYDNGERPINVDVSNIVWLGSDKSKWIAKDSKVQLSYLWESKNEKDLKGLFVKLPVGYKGTIKSTGEVMYSVVIDGGIAYTLPQNNKVEKLDEGSCFSASSKAIHTIENTESQEAVLYIRTNGTLEIQ